MYQIPTARQMVFTLQNNLIVLFILDPKGSVYMNIQNDSNEISWKGWNALGGTGISQLVIAENVDGRLELFALGGNQRIYHLWQIDTANPTAWAGSAVGEWAGNLDLPGVAFKQVEAIRSNDGDGRLVVFGLDESGNTYYITQTSANGGPNNNEWNEWNATALLSHAVKSIVAVRNSVDQCIELIAIGGNDTIYYNFQNQPNQLNTSDSGIVDIWNGWAPVGGNPAFDATNGQTTASIRSLVAILDYYSNLNIFVLCQDTEGTYYIFADISLTATKNPDWGGWSELTAEGKTLRGNINCMAIGATVSMQPAVPPFPPFSAYHLEFYAIYNSNQLVRINQQLIPFQGFGGPLGIPEWDAIEFLPGSKNLPYSQINLVTSANYDVVVLAYGKQQNLFAVNPPDSSSFFLTI